MAMIKISKEGRGSQPKGGHSFWLAVFRCFIPSWLGWVVDQRSSDLGSQKAHTSILYIHPHPWRGQREGRKQREKWGRPDSALVPFLSTLHLHYIWTPGGEVLQSGLSSLVNALRKLTGTRRSALLIS